MPVRLVYLLFCRIASWLLLLSRSGAAKYLIHDRDSVFTDAFDAVFAAANIEIKKTAPQTPKTKGHGLNLRAPLDDANVIPLPAHRITRTKILGGLINEYDTAA